MHRLLLGLAVGAALAAPASSKSSEATGFSASAAFHGANTKVGSRRAGVWVHPLIEAPGGTRRERHRSAWGAFAYPYPPQFYDENYDIDRNWDANSFNDWWHDRPDRAYPRWVWRNRGCSEDRMWSSGAGWRCTP